MSIIGLTEEQKAKIMSSSFFDFLNRNDKRYGLVVAKFNENHQESIQFLWDELLRLDAERITENYGQFTGGYGTVVFKYDNTCWLFEFQGDYWYTCEVRRFDADT